MKNHKREKFPNAAARGVDPGKFLDGIYPVLSRLARTWSRPDARDPGAALRELQRGLTGDRALAGSGYFTREAYLGAYLLYYWPVSFVQVLLALEETSARGFLATGARVLDLGAGPGPASFAALAMGATSCLLLDSSSPALEAASLLSADSFPGTPNPVSTCSFDLEGGGSLPEGPFDLVVACHCVNELWKGRLDALDRSADLLMRAADRLSDGGILLVVEPSAAVTAIPALQLRDRLIGADGGRPDLACVAPCPGSMPCPALAAGEGRSCHSTWEWSPPREIAILAAEAGLDRDSAKATWFALAKTGAGRSAAGGKSPGGRLQAAGHGGAGQGSTLSGRVVSEPLLNKAGRIRFIVCAQEGLATVSAPSTAANAAVEAFLGLSRGDCFRAEGLAPRPGERNFGFELESTLAVEFRAPEVP